MKNTGIIQIEVPIPPIAFERSRARHYIDHGRHENGDRIVTGVCFSVGGRVAWAESPIQRVKNRRSK